MCLPKSRGGLGFKDLEKFNQALLAKQLWRLHQKPHSLLARTLRGRYFRGTSPLLAPKPSRPSYGWRSIWNIIPIFVKGVRRTVGNGQHIKVWSDNWLPGGIVRPPQARGCIINMEMTVKDLLIPQTTSWNRSLVEQLLVPQDVAVVLSIRPSNSVDDGFCWQHTKSGLYTVKSGYRYLVETEELSSGLIQEPSVNTLKEKIWNIGAPAKLRVFLWQVVSGALPVFDRLASRKMRVDSSCAQCGSPGESINHVLFTCPPARQCWALANIAFEAGSSPSLSLLENLSYLLTRGSLSANRDDPSSIFVWLLWFIWKARNAVVYRGQRQAPLEIVQLARAESHDWLMANDRQ